MNSQKKLLGNYKWVTCPYCDTVYISNQHTLSHRCDPEKVKHKKNNNERI